MKPFVPVPMGWYERLAGADAWGGCVSARSRCRIQALRKMVLNSVASEHSKRNYANALDEVFALCEERKQPLSRALLMEYRAAMLEKKLSASTVNVRLSAVRKLIGAAQRNGIIGAEGAANSLSRPPSQVIRDLLHSDHLQRLIFEVLAKLHQ
jgi:site-specific recombinase XerD